ncbi:MAG: hypothetical protein ACRDNK_01745 [Solirubrobacteraceae bacterium]
MDKLSRESRLRERRVEKNARKNARKEAAANGTTEQPDLTDFEGSEMDANTDEFAQVAPHADAPESPEAPAS